MKAHCKDLETQLTKDGKTVLLEGQEIANACWNFAQERNKIPDEIVKNRSSYRGIMLVEFPEKNGGSFDNIRFVVKPTESTPNSQTEEI